ncbi:zinc finger protein 84-like [Arapaima gigas]
MSVKNSLATDAQNAVKAEEEDKEAGASAREGEKQGQWTVPIDESEMYRLAETDNKEDVCLMKTPGGQSSSSTQNGSLSPLPPNSALPNTSEAVEKRFVCRHCGKSYTRRFSLNQHLKSCQRPVSAAVLQDAEKWLPVQLHEGRPSFECVQCGKSFSRRYNLVLHRKRYHSTSTAEAAAASHSGTEPTRTSAGPTRDASQDYVSQKRMLILPPPPEDQDGGARSKSTTAAGDWGIMSLPSVLPRKVTCECGSVFTCPRMLFEHLRMHAQESFICPQCGEDFHSWLSYESHLRSHRRSVCSNCQQTFSLHSSLVRHLTKNRCKANFPKGKKFICSHCSLELPNYPSLSLHMQNCQHNPSAKLIRCSTCSRGFSSRDALQRHLFTHSHTNAFRCLLCQRGYPSLQSLKDHQRKVHRIKAVQAK